jgi:thiamine biosynthesis lipoprotein ApbE
VDRCCALLQRHGIRHAIVSAGGDSRVLGDRRGRPWTIAIRDPRSADGVVALLPLQDVAVSTSGDYERCFVRDGVRHHHLLDPRTGRSPSHVRSVTIVAPDGLTPRRWARRCSCWASSAAAAGGTAPGLRRGGDRRRRPPALHPGLRVAAAGDGAAQRVRA